MEKEGARTQTLEQRHERRKQVMRLHKNALGIMKIVAMAGLLPEKRLNADLKHGLN